jgi:hypothetical protein
VEGDFVEGVKAIDNIVLAGLQLESHRFGVATVMTDELIKNPADGILGLAHSRINKKSLSRQRTRTPVEALWDDKGINPIVSFKIPRPRDKKNDGQLTIG